VITTNQFQDIEADLQMVRTEIKECADRCGRTTEIWYVIRDGILPLVGAVEGLIQLLKEDKQ
jgi:hypothetical protein